MPLACNFTTINLYLLCKKLKKTSYYSNILFNTLSCNIFAIFLFDNLFDNKYGQFLNKNI